MVYFYFDFVGGEKQRHERMLCSLLKQLSFQSMNHSEALKSLFTSCSNGGSRPTYESLMRTLNEMTQVFKNTFVVFDSLDECSERESLLNCLEEMIS